MVSGIAGKASTSSAVYRAPYAGYLQNGRVRLLLSTVQDQGRKPHCESMWCTSQIINSSGPLQAALAQNQRHYQDTSTALMAGWPKI